MSLRSARRRDLRLVPVAAAAWVAASVATHAPEAARVVAGCLWAGVVVVLMLAARARRGSLRTAAALAAVALASAGGVATQVAIAQPARALAASLAVEGGRAVTVVATVVGKVEPSAFGWRFDAVAEGLAYGPVERAVSFPVVVFAATRPDGLDLGASISARGTAVRADPGEREVLVVRAGRGIQVRAPPQGVLEVAAELRRGLLRATDGLPQPAAGLIAGLAVGDTSAVSAELDAAMKASSLSHLTAVSGANCALVVGLAFGLAALCGARRGIRVAAGLVCLTGFVVLVSPEPSVVRAAAMATIALLGLVLGRIGAGVSLLSLSVCVLLVLDPWLSGSLGFALSAAATGSLLLAAGPLAEGLARFMPSPLALALSVPLAAQLACGPLLVLVNPTVPLYGVLANLLAAPAAPIGTVLGLAACLASPLPVVSYGLAALAWAPAAWIAQTAATMSALPGSGVPWLAGWGGVVALALVGAAIGAVVIVRDEPPVRAVARNHAGPGPSGSPDRRRRRVRALAIVVLGATGACVLALGPGAGLADRLQTPTDWGVVACEVGQGDAILLRSGSRVALIDTGPDPAPLAACLDRFGVERVDLLVLTHFDLDHRGGVDAVIGRIGLLLHGPPGGPDDERLLKRLADGGAQLTEAHAGMSGTLGSARWRVLWPRASGAGYPPGNDASVVVDVTGGGLPTSLFLGDLSAGPQRAVVASGLLAPGYALVKVAHHGSADQAPELYRQASPALALVTVGENDYGHPREETLSLLTGLGTTVARTDTDGAVAVTLAPDGLHVWRERAPAMP
ncbi:ComEC/Rec2 family competence protein [Microbacterium sp.]|uniref:ComEC/Rec2 family competence protein n=1 Tax=Microbacterium sp. TaxID=51671 RepID=UPI0039E4FCE1